MTEHLWAGWRVVAMEADREAAQRGDHAAAGTAALKPLQGQTLFEAICASGLPDAQTHVVWRGDHTFALLNRYPYSTGHLLVAPMRVVADLEDLDSVERSELWDAVHKAVTAVRRAFEPDGVNIGANIGEGAGPSVPDHLHIHVVPRWRFDTNFMTATADVRVLPLSLQDCWERVTKAWPT